MTNAQNAFAVRYERLARRLAMWLALPFVALVILTNLPPLGPFEPPRVAEEILKPLGLGIFVTAAVLFAGLTTSGLSQGVRFHWSRALADLAVVVTVWAFAATYLHEIIIEKPEIFPAWLQIDADPMERVLNGPPLWTVVIALCAVAALLFLNARTWGMPLVVVAILAFAYAVFCAVCSLMGWFPANMFLTYDMGARDPIGELSKYLIIGDSHSILGQFPSILIRVVLPFVLLGSVFASTGGGTALIKLAFSLTRKTRGGPAHAAVVSSSLFGTISGGPVVNVLSTGALTIPMMTRRGFKPRFAGAVEATASSGGQIMPPVMGVAAFFLANFTGVPYSQVVVAALGPALLFYVCLFISVSLEARKQGIEPVGELPPDLRMTRQDWSNLTIVIVPILVIVAVLVSQRFTIATAGIFALAALLPLTFIDPDIRRAPRKLLRALGGGAISAGSIYILFTAVAVVESSLSAVGFPNAMANLFASATADTGLFDALPYADTFYLFFVLVITMLATLVLGMGMPTLPAYANVAIIMTGGLANLGVAYFTANMFVFYFAVASAITPPVAVAAFAAASITKADPVATGLSSVRLGLMMFLVPFVFVIYPELLVIPPAFQADMISGEYIASHPEGFRLTAYLSILLRVLVAIYLFVTAISRFDMQRLSAPVAALRFATGVALLFLPLAVHGPALLLAIALIGAHHLGARRPAAVAGAGESAQ